MILTIPAAVAIAFIILAILVVIAIVMLLGALGRRSTNKIHEGKPLMQQIGDEQRKLNKAAPDK